MFPLLFLVFMQVLVIHLFFFDFLKILFFALFSPLRQVPDVPSLYFFLMQANFFSPSPSPRLLASGF